MRRRGRYTLEESSLYFTTTPNGEDVAETNRSPHLLQSLRPRASCKNLTAEISVEAPAALRPHPSSVRSASLSLSPSLSSKREMRVPVVAIDVHSWVGTELLAQAYEPECVDVYQVFFQDVDVFEEAGDDNTIAVELDAQPPGEHLIEIYSDCAADFLLTAD